MRACACGVVTRAAPKRSALMRPQPSQCSAPSALQVLKTGDGLKCVACKLLRQHSALSSCPVRRLASALLRSAAVTHPAVGHPRLTWEVDALRTTLRQFDDAFASCLDGGMKTRDCYLFAPALMNSDRRAVVKAAVLCAAYKA